MAKNHSDNFNQLHPDHNFAFFNTELDLYRRDYHKLIKSRSVEIDPLYTVMYSRITEESVAECLQHFYGDLPVGILFYFYEEETLSIWYLDRTGIRFGCQENVSEARLLDLERDLKRGLRIGQFAQGRKPLNRDFARQSIEESAPVALADAVQPLSQLLFPPALLSVLESSGVEHLIIVPALNLQQIPFALLQGSTKGELFIEKWSYSFAPSIYEIAGLMFRKQTKREISQMVDAASSRGDKSSYYQMLGEVARPRKKALFVGNPTFSSQSSWTLPDLPGAEAEVNAVSEKYLTEEKVVLIGSQATKAKIVASAQEAELLYLATHGVARPQDPLDGSGLFCAPGENDALGFWSAREIQDLELAADLVILSACQTGLGSSLDAGVVGLSRAFQLAGAENVIMSLWSVNDMATKVLMELFMEELQKDHTFLPAGALRAAMLAYRKENPDPLLWASFANMGIPY